MRKALKYLLIAHIVVSLYRVSRSGILLEWIERHLPVPEEWSFWTRYHAKTAKYGQSFNGKIDAKPVLWQVVAREWVQVLERLEDPKIDGADLIPQEGLPGLDITEKPEPWRRGYYEALLEMAEAAEYLDGWVLDVPRDKMFAPQFMIGPSNPYPKPMDFRIGKKEIAPKEEDCVKACEDADVFYMKILTTVGFTPKQRVDAALRYAEFLDYKKRPDRALEICEWALDIATEDCPEPVVDRATGVILPKAGPPSANVIAATTRLAVQRMKTQDHAAALPMFLSLLRARKSLPEAPKIMPPIPEPEVSMVTKAINFYNFYTTPFKYPPPPPDGTAPPQRDPKEICEEAGIMAYIGEILYAAKATKTSKEDGLAWTREAVDISEEMLRIQGINMETKKVCSDCLEVGLGNWSQMVARMAELEREQAAKSSGKSWLGFGGKELEALGRWESEEKVVRDRMQRASEVMLPKPEIFNPWGFQFV